MQTVAIFLHQPSPPSSCEDVKLLTYENQWTLAAPPGQLRERNSVSSRVFKRSKSGPWIESFPAQGILLTQTTPFRCSQPSPWSYAYFIAAVLCTNSRVAYRTQGMDFKDKLTFAISDSLYSLLLALRELFSRSAQFPLLDKAGLNRFHLFILLF
jgi:hypothetical protein